MGKRGYDSLVESCRQKDLRSLFLQFSCLTFSIKRLTVENESASSYVHLGKVLKKMYLPLKEIDKVGAQIKNFKAQAQIAQPKFLIGKAQVQIAQKK